VSWLTTTDHKQIGTLCLVTAFVFFIIGGAMALVMHAEPARPGTQIVSNEQFNQAFTMHGSVMLLLFAMPLFTGFANWLMPLQIGAPDVAFPRLKMLAYWLSLFGSLIAAAGFLTPQGTADFEWFAYAPLSDATHSPGIGADMWIMGVALSGFGSIFGAVNFITTVICMRAPGMTMFRMSIFTRNVLLTAVLILLVFPMLAAALFALEMDRKFGSHILDPANGGALLWQHLFEVPEKRQRSWGGRRRRGCDAGQPRQGSPWRRPGPSSEGAGREWRQRHGLRGRKKGGLPVPSRPPQARQGPARSRSGSSRRCWPLASAAGRRRTPLGGLGSTARTGRG
jgi:hypothetical protein